MPRQVHTVTAFVDAFNAADLVLAMAAFGPHPAVSDCDYRVVHAVEFTGRAGVARWLRDRFADHDRLAVGRIFNETNSRRVVGVEWASRTSDTLTDVGFPQGIRPQLSAKVVFTRSGQISTFANGPVGGSPDLCQPFAD